METMILLWIIGLFEFCMELFDEEETINRFFFYEFGSKRTLLGILVVFGLGLVDCNPQLRNICIKGILGFQGRCCQNFSNFGWS